MNENEYKKYIDFLEQRVATLSGEGRGNLEGLLKFQNELVIQRYGDREYLIQQNQDLLERIAKLERTVAIDYDYIKFLTNSKWWKMTLPLRFVSRYRVKKKFDKGRIDFKIDIEGQDVQPLNNKVLVLVFTYNAGEEFSIQLDKIRQQQGLGDLTTVVVDYGSTDNTVEIARSKKIVVIGPEDVSCYRNNLATKYDYVVSISQNQIIDDEKWIFKAIRPIEDGHASATLIFGKDFRGTINDIKRETYFYELKKRFCEIGDYTLLYLPLGRDQVQFLNPWILDKTVTIVRKLEHAQ